MELHELEPEKVESVPLEEPAAPAEAAKPPRKRRWARLLLLLPALVVCCMLVSIALNWTRISIALDPVGALKSGADRVMELPSSARLGFLGTVELGETSVNCSGVLELQTGGDALRLCVRDCTLGTDTDAATFSLYLSEREVAAQIPALTGGKEGWYGVSLETPIAEQAAGTGGEAEYGWYFQEPQLKAFQESADQAREALADAAGLTPSSEEREAVAAFLRSCEKSVEELEEAYVLHFAHPGVQETEALCRTLGVPGDLLNGELTMDFTLHKRGTLRSVELQSEGLSLFLELGEYPEREPTPRVEAEWGNGQNTLTLALTVERGEAPEAPEYQNAFSLLPRIG